MTTSNSFNVSLNLGSMGFTQTVAPQLAYGAIVGNFELDSNALDINPTINVNTYEASSFTFTVYNNNATIADIMDDSEATLNVSLTDYDNDGDADDVQLALIADDIFATSELQANWEIDAPMTPLAASAGNFTTGFLSSFPIAGWSGIYNNEYLSNGTVDLDVPLTTQRIEAEDADYLTNFRSKARSYFSGGDSINLGKGAQNELGVAGYTFNGVSGNYDLTALVCDETDGVGNVSIDHTMNGGFTYQIASIDLDSTSGIGGAKPASFRTLDFGGLYLNTGDTLTLYGQEDGGEHLAIDFLELTPVI